MYVYERGAIFVIFGNMRPIFVNHAKLFHLFSSLRCQIFLSFIFSFCSFFLSFFIRDLCSSSSSSSSSSLAASATMAEPAKKYLLPYLQRADELQKHEPLVAYYCENSNPLFPLFLLLLLFFLHSSTVFLSHHNELKERNR